MTSSFVKVVFADTQGSRLFFSGSRECAYSNAHTVSCEKRIYDINTGVYFYLEKIFHSLESDSARNNIHPNNKLKPEIANKNTGKITCRDSQPC